MHSFHRVFGKHQQLAMGESYGFLLKAGLKLNPDTHTTAFPSKQATITPPVWQKPVEFQVSVLQRTQQNSLWTVHWRQRKQDSANYLVRVRKPRSLQISSWNRLRDCPLDLNVFVRTSVPGSKNSLFDSESRSGVTSQSFHNACWKAESWVT